MSRDKGNKIWVTYETQNNPNQLMHTQDTPTEWQGGGEIRFGRRFGYSAWAVEAAYWSLAKFDTFAAMGHPNSVSTPLIFMDVSYADPLIPGLPQDLFNNAEGHRLWREAELHNVELNFVHRSSAADCGSRWAVGWLFGVRFFRFAEELTFGSLRGGATGWGVNPEWEGYLRDRAENNLIGPQVGSEIQFRPRNRWRILLTPVVGVYANYIENFFNAYRGDGQLFAVNPPDFPDYPLDTDEDAIAVLAQLDLVAEWMVTERIQIRGGYRVVALSGIALPDPQITPYVVDTIEIVDIDHNGDLILHGAVMGVAVQF